MRPWRICDNLRLGVILALTLCDVAIAQPLAESDVITDLADPLTEELTDADSSSMTSGELSSEVSSGMPSEVESPAMTQGLAPMESDRAIRSADDVPLIPRSVLWRSAVLPGWGQWRGGHRVKALLFAGAGAGWLAAVAVEHGRISEAPTPALYQDRVGRRNTHVLWYVITATAAAIDAYVDAHLHDFDVAEGFALSVGPTGDQAAVTGAALFLHF